jgi:hypothetical protein
MSAHDASGSSHERPVSRGGHDKPLWTDPTQRRADLALRCCEDITRKPVITPDPFPLCPQEATSTFLAGHKKRS